MKKYAPWVAAVVALIVVVALLLVPHTQLNISVGLWVFTPSVLERQVHAAMPSFLFVCLSIYLY